MGMVGEVKRMKWRDQPYDGGTGRGPVLARNTGK